MSYTSRTIGSVIDEVNRSYLLPAIQRPFVWSSSQVVGLFDSLLKGYPISSFMFWAVDEETKSEVRCYKFIENYRPDVMNEPTSAAGRKLVLVLDGHPAGHQGKLAARYILTATDGERIGLMFKKGEKSNAHLWVDERFVKALVDVGIELRVYPAASLYRNEETSDVPKYGRHSALKPMRDLANVTLVRFTIATIGQLYMILAHFGASPTELTS